MSDRIVFRHGERVRMVDGRTGRVTEHSQTSQQGVFWWVIVDGGGKTNASQAGLQICDNQGFDAKQGDP